MLHRAGNSKVFRVADRDCSYAAWLYLRFPLSLRMVAEMLAARGIAVTYETIRQWGLKSGRKFANRIRRRAPRRGDESGS
jgi:putative transposase